MIQLGPDKAAVSRPMHPVHGWRVDSLTQGELSQAECRIVEKFRVLTNSDSLMCKAPPRNRTQKGCVSASPTDRNALACDRLHASVMGSGHDENLTMTVPDGGSTQMNWPWMPAA